jgi:hypothetical protein
LINPTEFLAYKDDLTSRLNELDDTNTKIYFQHIPDTKFVPQIEPKIKISSLEDPELIYHNRFLEGLVLKGGSLEVETTKNILIDYIKTGLNKYKPEEIDAFLQSENLSFNINECIDNDPMLNSNEFWKQFCEIKANGSTGYFENSLYCYSNIHSELDTMIKKIHTMLVEEDEDDRQMRAIYCERWNRKASIEENQQIVASYNNYSAKLENAKTCNNQIKENVLNNSKLVYILNLTKEQLRKGLVKNERDIFEDIKNDLKKFKFYKDEMNEVIEKLFVKLKEENIIELVIKAKQENKQAEKVNFGLNF